LRGRLAEAEREISGSEEDSERRRTAERERRRLDAFLRIGEGR